MSRRVIVRPLAQRIGNMTVHIPTVRVGNRTVTCDDHLPGDLARLIPPAWGNASPAAWQSFVDRAIARGML